MGRIISEIDSSLIFLVGKGVIDVIYKIIFTGTPHVISPATTPVTLTTLGTLGVPSGGGAVTSAAVHQMPSVIPKPKLYVSQPSQVINIAPNNGPNIASSLANGSHVEIKKEGWCRELFGFEMKIIPLEE